MKLLKLSRLEVVSYIHNADLQHYCLQWYSCFAGVSE
jgi:hypothetical protein